MDPYLEQPALWASFHSRLIVALADAIESAFENPGICLVNPWPLGMPLAKNLPWTC